MGIRRIRDPLHDLIVFDSSELERTLWKVIETRPFQRLRRVKQLGFSDLVYPGAGHSRFAHSVGVFYTARQLMAVVHGHVKEDETSKEQKALAAALVHDLGHGPFSHAFEEIGERLGLKLADHETMSDTLIRQSEVGDVLNKQFGRGFADDVADIIQKGGVKTVQHAVVSSQFDADRLDYIRRDRMMTGSQHAAIDFPWLMANLEIGTVPIGIDDEQVGTIETFVLGPKAIHAAEAFVLGLFQLYPTIYFHKATRGAEKLFSELVVQTVNLVRQDQIVQTGLPANHPLVRFALNSEDIDVALSLDDTVVYGALTLMTEARDPLIAEFAGRIRDRKLYKCCDVRTQVTNAVDPTSKNTDELIAKIDKCCAEIGKKIGEWTTAKSKDRPRILIDEGERSPYKSVNESKGPLDRINIRTDAGKLVDLKERSAVVAALKTFKLFRTYASSDDGEAQGVVRAILQEEIKTCLSQA